MKIKIFTFKDKDLIEKQVNEFIEDESKIIVGQSFQLAIDEKHNVGYYCILLFYNEKV